MGKITIPELKLSPMGKICMLTANSSKKLLALVTKNQWIHVISLSTGQVVNKFELCSEIRGFGFTTDNSIYIADDNFGVYATSAKSLDKTKLRLNVPVEMQKVTDFTCCEQYMIMCSEDRRASEKKSYITVYDVPSKNRNALFFLKNQEEENFKKCVLYRKGNLAAIISDKSLYKLNIAAHKLNKVVTVTDETMIGCCMISSRGLCYWSDKKVRVFIDSENTFEEHFECPIPKGERVIAVTRGEDEDKPIWAVFEDSKKAKTFVKLSSEGEKAKIKPITGTEEVNEALWERDFFFFTGGDEGIVRQRKLPPPSAKPESDSSSSESSDDGDDDDDQPSSSSKGTKQKKNEEAEKKDKKKAEKSSNSKREEEPEKKKSKK